MGRRIESREKNKGLRRYCPAGRLSREAFDEARRDIRFAVLKDANALDIYHHIVYGAQEAYTSTFNGLFDILKEKMAKEGITGDELLRTAKHNKFLIFLNKCAEYNRLQEFLDSIENAEKVARLLTDAVSGLETAKEPLNHAS